MIRREGRRLLLSGPVTLANVAQVLQEGRGYFEEGRRRQDEGVNVVDLGGVNEMNSALLALLLAWARDAKRRERALAFENLPASLRTLAGLYGVEGLLAAAPGAARST
jgi:phospholipid transport system transporter-binding protein